MFSTVHAMFNSGTTTQVAWSPVKLSDLLGVSIQNGLYKPLSAYGSGTPIIRINDFNNEGQFVSLEFQRLIVSAEERDRYGLALGDILINRVNSLSHIGKSVLVRDLAEPTIYESNMMRLRLNRETLMPEFFAYLLQTSALRDFFKTRAKKAVAQASINQEDVKAVEFLLPPLLEQRKIAEILSTWDEAIRLSERMIAAKQRRKQGLMQRLLTGQVRFAEFGHQQSTTETRIGTLPADWQVHRLADVAQILVSNVDKKSQSGHSPVLLCNYMDVFKNDYIHKNMAFMEATATEAEIAKFTVKINDVIITKDSETREEIAQASVVVEPLENVVCGYHLAIIRSREQILDGKFLKHAMESSRVHEQFVKAANGVTRYGLSLAAIHNALVPVPPLSEQQKIAAVVRILNEELALHERQLAGLRRQKQGLMQRLLTGAVRVSTE